MKPTFALLLASLTLLAQVALADDLDWQADVHYHLISPAPPPGQTAGVEVAEFFWYGCPHCYQFEPYVKQWLQTKPEDVRFVRIPAMFGGAADLHARAYYALEVMGELERLHEPFFKVIQEEKRKLRSPAELEEWVQSQGVDVEKFRATMDSFAVHAKVNRAQSLMRRYGVRSVPTMVVDARYRSGSGFRGYEDVIEVTKYLVDKVRSSQAAAAATQ
ncbi:MAG: thiol:disulfide interchange protein DsbA [Pseudomonadota bacterium]|jgi:thiol:disulfide interchange protein DsbA